MKPFFHVFSIACATFALTGLGACHSETSDVEAMASDESPAASLTAEEAAAYASYVPDMDFDTKTPDGEVASK